MSERPGLTGGVDIGSEKERPEHDAGRLAQGDVLRTPGAMCYKTPGLLTASVVWPGAWRGPIGIKPGRIYPRSPPDQPSDWPATKDCGALVPNLSTTLQALLYCLRSHPWVVERPFRDGLIE
jgi:hypothetical protein